MRGQPWLPAKGVRLPETKSLGAVVLGVRLKRGWSRAELARRAGVDDDEIRCIEEANRQPSWEIIERLGVALGFSGWWLLRMCKRHANGLL